MSKLDKHVIIDPDIIRGRAVAEAVKAAGGDAMAQALAWIGAAFDETAAACSAERRKNRPPAFLKPDNGAPRTACIIDSLPRR